MSEYWFCPDLSCGRQIKPIYAWAGGRPPVGLVKDESVQFDVSWNYLKSASWEQMSGATPLSDDLSSGMQSDSPFVRVLMLGESWLMTDTYVEADAPQRPAGRAWEMAFAANITQHPQVGIGAASTPEWSAKLLQGFRCPLEFLEAEPRVRRIVHADGRLRCLIVAFAIREDNPRKLPGFGERGTIVHSVGATDQDPAGLEMLELFVVQYRSLYKRFVEPCRGKPTMLTPQPTYSFLGVRDWSMLDVQRLPTEVRDVIGAVELTQAYADLMMQAGLHPVAKEAEARRAGEDETDEADDLNEDQEQAAVEPTAKEILDCAIRLLTEVWAHMPGFSAASVEPLFKVAQGRMQILELLAAGPARLKEIGINAKNCELMLKAFDALGGIGGILVAARKIKLQEAAEKRGNDP